MIETITVLAGFFSLGFFGGFGHCIAMCHPFVLHISSKYSENNSGYKILIPNLLYNLGRTFTYSILGAIIAVLGSITTYAGNYFLNIQKLAAILGGFIILIFAILFLLNISSFNFLSKLPIINKLKSFTPSNPFFYGIILGFLPCGLSMNAFILAIPSGSWYMGALMLFLFGIGTSVAMMLLSIFGSYIMKYIKQFKYITAFLLLAMGVYYIYYGVNFTY